jgi:hypothetical protein
MLLVSYSLSSIMLTVVLMISKGSGNLTFLSWKNGDLRRIKTSKSAKSVSSGAIAAAKDRIVSAQPMPPG